MNRSTIIRANVEETRWTGAADRTSEASRPDASAVRRWSIALVLLCLASLWLQFRHIDRTLPYPWDTDEGFVSGPASRTVTTGTFHPYTFNYPSLPKYLAAGGMAVGFVRAASHLEIRDVHDIGNVGYPYYDTPRVMQGARELFALLAVIALAATGIAAWHAFHEPSAILIAPLMLALSPLYFYQSWTYLNVDIVGLCFSTMTIAATLQGTRRPSMVRSAVIPAAFAGLAASSKYTLALVIVPVLVAIGLYLGRGRRMWGSLLALAVMVLAFVASTPYSLIDLPNFLSGVAFETFHYARGHAGWEADPGLPQVLFYARHFVSDYGPIAVAVSLVGAAAFCVADWRRALVLLAFPVALGWLLVSQRVHFERNVLSVHHVVTMFAAFGLITIQRWIVAWARRREWNSVALRRLGLGTALALLAATIPWWHLPDEIRDRTDSRTAAVRWMIERVPADFAVVVPTQLRFDARPLKKRGTRIVEVDLQSARDADAFHRTIGEAAGAAVLLLPHWGADERFEGQKLADQLNALGNGLTPLKSFGRNPVLVNYAEPAPWGDPQFAIVTLRR